MRKFLSHFIFITTIAIVLVNCANRGSPGGGEKDVLPPEITKSVPENYSTNFTGNEIKIYFNEYIKVKNLTKQLIISPPMDPAPEVTPLGSASKYITIKIYDTLQPNTTYAFNFGNSIVDNNEENPFTYYKYVFSTGNYIDSLSVKGTIKDALQRNADTFVSVGLYEVDSTYNDSLVYKQKPKYVTNTLDSITEFSIDNIKAGKYMMVALKDGNEDNIFQQKTDKIGFYPEIIEVPTEQRFELALFKEFPEYKATRPKLISGEKIAFGYEGDYKNMDIELLSKKPEGFESRVIKDTKSDTLNYFYLPRIKSDSLIFKVSNKTVIDTFTVKISEQKRDSLTVKQLTSSVINFSEDFKITANVPFKSIDESKISVEKDSVTIPFKGELDTIKNLYSLKFDKEEDSKYAITILPEAFTGFFGTKNDTINYRTTTKTELSYGNVRVKLQNATYPVIAQLTDDKGEVKAEQYAEKEQFIDFRFLEPGNYFLRVITDSNKNKVYDSGSYLKKQQAERVSHMKGKIELSAGFDMTFDFTLD
ncbi:Ig-like domain-containing protein [Lacinutrix salivirga]